MRYIEPPPALKNLFAMRRTLPFVIAVLLTLLLVYALRQFDENYQPEKYIFQYETVVPSGGVDCDSDLLSNLLTWGDSLGEKKRTHIGISEDMMEEYSLRVMEHISRQHSILHDHRRENLQAILDKMRPHLIDPTADYRIYLLDTRMVNAFAAIGNNIFFTAGLYELAESDDERAMVIGHELGHQENGHVYEAWQKIEKWRKRLNLDIFGMEIDLSKYADIIGGIENIISTPFQQPDEKEADLAGAYLTYKAGYDPETGVRIFHKFKALKDDSSTGVFARLLSTHPVTDERIACLDNYIAAAKLRAERERPHLNTWEKLVAITEANKQTVLAIALPVLLILLFSAWNLLKSLRLDGPSFWSLSALALSLAMIAASSFFLHRYSGEFLHLASVESDYPDRILVGQKAVIYIQDGRLNVRAQPSIEAEVLFQLAKGVPVDCIECCCNDIVNDKKGKWCKITTAGGETGWCWGWYLQLVE